MKHICSKLVTDEGISIDVSEEQPEKQNFPKLVTDKGIRVFLHPATILFDSVSMIALQFSRESYLGLSASTTMDSRKEQPEKQLVSKLVTDEGSSIDVSEEQLEKQYSPKLITDEGIRVFLHPVTIVFDSVSMIALQSSRESYFGLLTSTTMDSREEQPEKHPAPKLVTDEGSSIDVREAQP